jgi:formylglycine-generating enzyme required for sulfatase activity
MALIPAGSFEMGDSKNETESWMKHSRPVHTVQLDGFYMDKTEVTVGQFKAFLADSDHDWDQWASVVAIYGEDDEDSLADDYPMIYVNWHDAVAYAEWDSKSDLGEAVASGVYFVQFTTDDQTQTRRLVILK